MAEGGILPWRVQSNSLDKKVVYADYSHLSEPLPKPPPGIEWRHEKTTGTWVLEPVAGATSAVAEAVPTVKPSTAELLPPFIEHVVLPHDTLQGVCLRYKISARVLRKHNSIFGDTLSSCEVLRIPTAHFRPGDLHMLQTDAPEVKVQVVVNRTKLPALEARLYLEDHDWDVEAAVKACVEDDQWEGAQADYRSAQAPDQDEEKAPDLPVVVRVPLRPNQVELELGPTAHATPVGTKC